MRGDALRRLVAAPPSNGHRSDHGGDGRRSSSQAHVGQALQEAGERTGGTNRSASSP
jgi:hypothetical protein